MALLMSPFGRRAVSVGDTKGLMWKSLMSAEL